MSAMKQRKVGDTGSAGLPPRGGVLFQIDLPVLFEEFRAGNLSVHDEGSRVLVACESYRRAARPCQRIHDVKSVIPGIFLCEQHVGVGWGKLVMFPQLGELLFAQRTGVVKADHVFALAA